MKRKLSLLLVMLVLVACGNKGEKPEVSVTETKAEESTEASVAPRAMFFEDVTAQSNIVFVHNDGRTGDRYYVETSASGGGFFDYDNDGDLDMYLLNGARPPGSDGAPYRNHMYRNDGGRFTDVTAETNTGDVGYGQGMAVGDYDGDGWLDLFVTNFGHNAMYRNKGDGSFEEVSDKIGIREIAFSTGAAFADLDQDGDLDLYVSNNVSWDYDNNKQCGFGTQHIKSYCRPNVFQGQTDYIYINQGDGTFREEGRARGVNQGLDDRGFCVIASDMDNDGDPDIMIANDGSANRLYRNDGNGYFEDISEISGMAYNGNGESEAGMGMDVGDFDGDGLMDQIITNYSMETNTLYHNSGDLFFEDATNRAGLANASYNPVGWGAHFLDYDNDGQLDLAVANGHLMDNIEQINAALTYHQPNHLFRNTGNGSFEDVTAQAGSGFTEHAITRGLAVADLDDDGRLDILFTNTNAAPNLLMNRVANDHHWIGFKLKGKKPNLFAIGTRVRFYDGDTYLGMREVRSGGSFLSQSDFRIHFGLGDLNKPIRAEFIWPDGHKSEAVFDKLDQYHEVTYP